MLFDAHFHVIDPRFPLIPNQGYLPDPFTSEDYQHQTANLDIQGGAIVSGSFQAFDQRYLTAAIKTLGKNFVGVTQLPASTTDEEIIKLNQQGIRALRFNLFRGGSESVEHLADFAQRVFDLVGWHVELYVDSKDLDELSNTVLSLPKVSIDHLGISKAGFKHLLALAEFGVKVKATGFMRVDFDVKHALETLYAANPDALMFGTDLPGTRASRQFSIDDLKLIQDGFAEDACHKILWQNAADFYGVYTKL